MTREDREVSMRLWLSFWLVVVVAAACSSSGSNDPGDVVKAGGTCQHFNSLVCGETAQDAPAVLQCNALGIWTVQEICLSQCVLYNMQPRCLTAQDVQVPDGDAGLDSAEEPDTLDLAADLDDSVADPDGVSDLKDVKQDIAPIDLQPDFTPPTILSTSPAAGEMGVAIPFTVRIEFSEPMHKVTVAQQTVRMFNAAWDPVAIDWSWEEDGNTILIIQPKIALFGVSAYTVDLGAMISDLAGNNLGTPYRFTFYTGLQADHSSYLPLVRQFAPLIYAGTNADNPHYDYPTRYDLDGNWNPMDNVDYIKGPVAQIEPYVYYSVAETKSHYFLFYMFFFPYRKAELAGHEFGNDVSGSMVVVRKSDQQPVAVETYFKKQGDDERSLSFATDDSGFIASGETAESSRFEGVYSRGVLFPGSRYVAWLSPGKHESCLWLDENNGPWEGCELYPAYKPNLSRIELKFQSGNPTPIVKQGGSFPAKLNNVDFGLLYILDTLWARRSDVAAGQVFSSSYEYEPFSHNLYPNRPQLPTEVGSSFAEPIGNDNGRPPWAWRYFPGNGIAFYQMPRGVFFLDPALHFRLRHDLANKWASFDGTSGWSVEYCFNPYFNIDFRGIWPQCSNP